MQRRRAHLVLEDDDELEQALWAMPLTSIRAVSPAAVAPAFVPPPLVRATPSKQMVFDRKAARIKALSEAHAAALESVEEQTGNLESVVP